MIKRVLIILAILSFLAAVIGGLFFESHIKAFYPGFSSVLFFSGLIFFGGIGYAIIERNMTIGIMAVFISFLIPLLGKWMASYWHWVVYQLGKFLK